MSTYRFAASGFFALHPEAFGIELVVPESRARDFKMVGSTAVVEVQGPIHHHHHRDCDSFDDIKERVARALTSSAERVVLAIDSPGGDVGGCFDTVAEIRALAAQHQKPIDAYVDAQSCSAGYALALAGDRIFIPGSGIAGSVGVIASRLDTTALDTAMGVKFTLITSGRRKSDGNPHAPVTDEEMAAQQIVVDALSEQFFALVRARRPQVNEDEVFTARTFVGQDAVDVGLADAVVDSLDQVLATLAAPATAATAASGEAMTYKEMVTGLKSLAADENAPAEEREKARKALAAMEGEPDGDEKKDAKAEDDEPKKDAAKAEDHKEPDGDEPKKDAKAEDDEEEPKAAVSNQLLRAMASDLAALRAERDAANAKAAAEQRAKDDSERNELLASLTGAGFSAAAAALKGKPLATVREMAAALMPQAKKPTGNTVRDARAALQGGVGAIAASAQDELDNELDVRMGLKPARAAIKAQGTTLFLSAAASPEEVRKARESMIGGAK